MTRFWYPLRQRSMAFPDFEGKHFKKLGSGLYQLWGRCDMCAYSGPSQEFDCYTKGCTESLLCLVCSGRHRNDMLADGWRLEE
jgi:hypothetical protein